MTSFILGCITGAVVIILLAVIIAFLIARAVKALNDAEYEQSQWEGGAGDIFQHRQLATSERERNND